MSSYVGTADAAALIGATPRRVRDLLATGHLAGERISGRWLVDADALAARAARPPLAVRPMSARVAWGAAALADDRSAPWLAPSEVSRLRARMARMRNTLTWQAWLRSRGEVAARLYVAAEDREALLADGRVVLTGISAAREYRVGLRAYGGEDEVYVRSADELPLRLAYGLVSSDRPNLTVRIAPVDDADFAHATAHRSAATGRLFVPTLIAAVDLLESSDARSRQAGLRLLDRFVER